MIDNDWVRAINNKSISTGGNILAYGVFSAGGIVELDQMNITGTSCSRNGNLSRDASGEFYPVLTAFGMPSDFTGTINVKGNIMCNKSGQSIAYCPAGYRMMSGGYVMTKWSDSDGRNAPDSSFPDSSING